MRLTQVLRRFCWTQFSSLNSNARPTSLLIIQDRLFIRRNVTWWRNILCVAIWWFSSDLITTSFPTTSAPSFKWSISSIAVTVICLCKLEKFEMLWRIFFLQGNSLVRETNQFYDFLQVCLYSWSWRSFITEWWMSWPRRLLGSRWAVNEISFGIALS